MPPKHKIDIFPEELRTQLEIALRQGATVDQLEEVVASAGFAISRSSVGRWASKKRAALEKMKSSRDLAKVLVAEYGDAADSQVAQANIELLHASLMEVMHGDDELTPKNVSDLARALSDLTKAKNQDIAAIEKIETRVRAKAMADAANMVDQAAKDLGLTNDGAAAIRAKLLGIG